jgi:hypothetical protein
VLVGGTVCRVPDWHWLMSKHLGAFSMVESVFTGQVVHTRLADGVGSAETYEPGAQVRQAVHDVAFVAVLNWPLGQIAQERSWVAEAGGVVTYWPAAHERCGVHTFAFIVELKLPAWQSAHVRSVVALPVTLT